MLIVAQICGGLGNQLFQYAASRAFALQVNAQLELDSSAYRCGVDRFKREFLLDKFNVHTPITTGTKFYGLSGTRMVLKMASSINTLLPKQYKSILEEKGPFYAPIIVSDNTNRVYLIGYWQSCRYFESYWPQIKSDLLLISPLDKKNKEIEGMILDSESVSIHVRQSDLRHKLTASYYYRALEIIKAKVNKPKYFIFSDSFDLARQLAAEISAKHIDVNPSSEAYKDLWLMSRCRYHIAANSTFSWWGAWLADSAAKQVIVPSSIRNFNVDIIPPGWMALDY